MTVRPIDGNSVKRREWNIAEAWRDRGGESYDTCRIYYPFGYLFYANAPNRGRKRDSTFGLCIVGGVISAVMAIGYAGGMIV